MGSGRLVTGKAWSGWFGDLFLLAIKELCVILNLGTLDSVTMVDLLVVLDKVLDQLALLGKALDDFVLGGGALAASWGQPGIRGLFRPGIPHP